MTKELKEKLIAVLDKQSEAREYLNKTDYIVIKLAEVSLSGDDLTELKTTYSEQLAKRKEYRASIDTLQVELNALNEELKASEKAKNDEAIIEDVIEQPVEETPTEQPVEKAPTDTSEVVEGTTTEKVVEQPTNTPTEPVAEVDTTDQTSDNTTDITNTTNTSESIEEQPIDTTEETITEGTPITEEVI